MGDRTGDDIYISPKYKIEQWKALDLDPDNPNQNDWNTAVDILDDRITERFLKPAQYLIDAPVEGSLPTFGFAILALDFLVIETIQGFRDGRVDHKWHSTRLFTEFCADWEEFSHCLQNPLTAKDDGKLLYEQGRCALHHSGTTDRLTVGITGKMITFNDDQTIRINRTEFHEQLVEEFKRYLLELRDPDSVDLRQNFKRKMNSICGMTE
ncbi:hypothetical protein [Agrobacterium fabrum]|uniref:hypothetical protein n=1 Tax=Agrobacterium fabrum TaxID=1176649 RepID=UPI000EF5362D|nr:hypothetical protein [Agrobacterium fabrum]AYM57303.1 hypothetical protein At1D132_12860 [Agrobacterium fabrum]NSZ11661.1 hypothetical protein [Agrobacterium fabrum]